MIQISNADLHEHELQEKFSSYFLLREKYSVKLGASER